MSVMLRILDIINTDDKDLKKIVTDITILEIILLIYKYELEEKNFISVDNFLENNKIRASRSKKLAIINNLEINGIIEREIKVKDRRVKKFYLNKVVKEKIKKFL